MFEGLKNKFKNLINKITTKEEEKKEEPVQIEPKVIVKEEPTPIIEEIKTPEPIEPLEPELEELVTQQEPPKLPEPEKQVEKIEEPVQTAIVKPGFFSKIKNFFSNTIKIRESEVKDYFQDLDLELLQDDVSPSTSEKIIQKIKEKIIEQEIEKSEVQEFVKDKIRETLEEILIEGRVEITQKPFSIMLVGPNGMGKTTTVAKLAYLLTKNKYNVLLAASDTFRKGAIEQLENHAEKIGVKLIKQQYGADPASIAFDALQNAKSQQVDVVIIDTAGRQDNNFNLINEMEKISRVVKPDLTLFVAESVAGQTNIRQIETFAKTIKIDGVIITKLDCDAKGGTIFTICNDLKKPIYYECFGQEYDQIRPFEKKQFVDRILI